MKKSFVEKEKTNDKEENVKKSFIKNNSSVGDIDTVTYTDDIMTLDATSADNYPSMDDDLSMFGGNSDDKGISSI